MNTVYFYLYLIVVVSGTVALNILRCVFNVKTFDIFLYPNHNNNIIENTTYLLSHIIINFTLGYLFGFDVILGMLVKIMLFEVYVYLTEYCDIFKTSKVSHLIIIIMVSLVSYTAGCLVKKMLS